jgi:hypothetical protein
MGGDVEERQVWGLGRVVKGRGGGGGRGRFIASEYTHLVIRFRNILKSSIIALLPNCPHQTS